MHLVSMLFYKKFDFYFFVCYNNVIKVSKEVFYLSNPNDKYTKDTETRFTLRVDTDLLNKVKANAEKNKRSTAKEIIFILEKYFENNHSE